MPIADHAPPTSSILSNEPGESWPFSAHSAVQVRANSVAVVSAPRYRPRKPLPHRHHTPPLRCISPLRQRDFSHRIAPPQASAIRLLASRSPYLGNATSRVAVVAAAAVIDIAIATGHHIGATQRCTLSTGQHHCAFRDSGGIGMPSSVVRGSGNGHRQHFWMRVSILQLVSYLFVIVSILY